MLKITGKNAPELGLFFVKIHRNYKVRNEKNRIGCGVNDLIALEVTSVMCGLKGAFSRVILV